jgi:aromatic-L-amino-acid decarboxylase
MTGTGDLPPDQARLWMHRIAGWVADYRDKLEQHRITPEAASGDIAAALPAELPEQGEPLAALFEEFDRAILPGVLHRAHPRFLDAPGAAPTAPAILGEWLAAAVRVDVAGPRSGPAAAEVETTVLGWIRGMLGLPEAFAAVVHDSPAAATLHALAAARDAAVVDVQRRGMAGAPPLMLYASEHARPSVEAAAATLGLGVNAIRWIEADSAHRMRPTALRAAVARDVHARLRPLAVVATVGTAASAAVDPLPAIADVCRDHGLWLHVDATYGGALAVLPEGRWALEGVARADSVVIDPPTWLFVPPGFTALYTSRLDELRAASVPGQDGRDGSEAHEGLARGRAFRALGGWMVFRAFGRGGLEARIREQVRLARRFAEWVEADPDFELGAPVTMAVVCFRAAPLEVPPDALDELNRRLVDEVNAAGRAVLSPTRLGNTVWMRIVVGNVLTTEAHLAEAWSAIRGALRHTGG